jgi:hypothetical protein
MKIQYILIIGAFAMLIGIIVMQQIEINRLEGIYDNEKVLFDANFGEVVRLKDDLGAYADSCRLLRKEIDLLQNVLKNE